MDTADFLVLTFDQYRPALVKSITISAVALGFVYSFLQGTLLPTVEIIALCSTQVECSQDDLESDSDSQQNSESDDDRERRERVFKKCITQELPNVCLPFKELYIQCNGSNGTTTNSQMSDTNSNPQALNSSQNQDTLNQIGLTQSVIRSTRDNLLNAHKGDNSVFSDIWRTTNPDYINKSGHQAIDLLGFLPSLRKVFGYYFDVVGLNFFQVSNLNGMEVDSDSSESGSDSSRQSKSFGSIEAEITENSSKKTISDSEDKSESDLQPKFCHITPNAFHYINYFNTLLNQVFLRTADNLQFIVILLACYIGLGMGVWVFVFTHLPMILNIDRETRNQGVANESLRENMV